MQAPRFAAHCCLGTIAAALDRSHMHNDGDFAVVLSFPTLCCAVMSCEGTRSGWSCFQPQPQAGCPATRSCRRLSSAGSGFG